MNMKRLFFGFAFLMTIQVNAQNYLINFAGTGAATAVSRVKVENLTAGTTLTVNKGEILRLIGTGGLSTIDDKQYSIKIYPNPMTGSNAVLVIYPPDQGNAIISIFDLAGRLEAQLVCYLGNYPQEYRLSGIKNGLHLISVTGKTYHFSGRLLCAGEAAGTISIERITSNNPGDEKISESAYIRDNTTVNMPYTYGDRLKFTGISKIYSTVKTDIPEADKTITFNFIPCSDGDNNNYPIVEIGSQVWMARNLKTTKYNNGSPIEYPGINSKSWNSNTSGAFAWYDDDITKYEDVYGALYNWHAVSTGNLCPVGWHVPDNEDWIILTEFLGGRNIAGEKIKETGNLHWAPSNNYSTNESGFTAVPGGFRNLKSFTEINHYGYMWSSGAGSKTNGARGWYLNSISEGLNESDMNYLNEGLSVRCILGETGSIPVVSTDQITDISSNSANCGGTLNSDGGETITARGICWSTSQDPTLSDYVTSDTLATDKFIISLSGLLPGTTYHVRAYATNNLGTAYGNDVSFITSPIMPPILSTTEVSSVTSATASSGGNIIDDGGGQITNRGICWATTPAPSISDYQTSNGAGKGSFTSDMTGLLPGTTYYIRAYAVNSAGTEYGNEITFTTYAVVPVITTTAVINITRTAATSGGNITSDGGSAVNLSGVCWGIMHNPSITGAFTTDGTLTGTFASNISGLIPGTIYYIRAYATNSAGTAYGDEVTFTTYQIGLAILTTTAVSSVTSASAVSGGNITDDGDGKITVRGICWSTVPAPSINDDKTANGKGTGSFTSIITGLMPGTSYHVRAYATNSAGTSYGNDITFTTDSVTPTITTTAVYDVTRTTATSGGNITSNGGAVVTTSGICWGTSHNPSIAGSHTIDGTSSGNFTSSLTSLVPNTLYYLRAYATNNAGTGYGNEVSFTTNPVVPATLTTTAVSSVTSTSASSGGNITDDGDGTISTRGICWATDPAPTISDSKTSNGTGTGSFTGSLTGLLPGTSYHVRAYATNSAGTAYGNDLTFSTDANIPTIITAAAYNITSTTATSGGNITSNGGSAVTVSGVCWGTSHNPSVGGSHTSDGAGSGVFASSISGLLPNTLYYIRAYAVNGVGIGYGNELSFTTNPLVKPSVTTTAISSITASTASSGGNITDDGGAPISARGICWATNATPTIGNDKTTDGTGTGSFTSNMTGLNFETTYYVRAYATNSIGTMYGNQLSFTTTPRPDSDLTFGTSADGSILLHSVGDKRIIFKTIGTENYIKYSSDNGATYNQGIRITNIFTDNNKARILSNGNIVLFCSNKIYYSDNNLATITPCIVQNKDGSPYVYHTPVNPAYPGAYFYFMGGFAEYDGVAVMGTYTNASMGASPVNLYYTLDGITWKVFYTFGQNPNYTDNGTAQGGTGGTLLGDPNNPSIARHIHAVNIGQDGNFYACTGDWNTELHILKCSYDKLADAWSTIDLLSNVSRTWQRMRALGVYERNGYLYWGSDGPGTFIYNGVQYDCLGIYKCAVADINDASKHILLKSLSDACYSFLNVDHIVFAGMQSYGYVYISYDYGETWSEYTKPGWMDGTVQGVWYNQMYKYLVTNWGVIIKSILF
jgi:uncharacterized protein (TIGR02145 family)